MLEVHVQMELKRHLVEHLVQLLSCGHVLQVTLAMYAFCSVCIIHHDVLYILCVCVHVYT